MTPHDPVRDLLRRRGAPDHLVEGGLPGLVEEWGKTARSVADGYPLGLDDYLNDMDLRQLLNDALESANDIARMRELDRLTNADDLLRAHTVPVPGASSGSSTSRSNDTWRPAVPSPAMRTASSSTSRMPRSSTSRMV